MIKEAALTLRLPHSKTMRNEYDIKELNLREIPYATKLKKQVTINLNVETINYFKDMSEKSGVPYQTLISLYLADCVENKRKLV